MKTLFKTIALLVFTITIAFAAVSCDQVKPLEKTQLGGYWVLKTMDGKDAKDLFKGSQPSIEFNFTDSLVSGNAGCNNYFGNFSLNTKNEFSAPHLGMTMMMCMEENAEPQFAKAMGEKSVLSIDTNGLLTFKQNDKVVFQFAKGEKPTQPKEVATATPELISGTWVLNAIPGENITTLFAESIPTAEFDTIANKVFGNAGCNNFNATYKLDNGVLTAGPLMTTKMACPNLEGETKFVKLFENPLDASINDGELTFYKDGAVVMSFVRTEEVTE